MCPVNAQRTLSSRELEIERRAVGQSPCGASQPLAHTLSCSLHDLGKHRLVARTSMRGSVAEKRPWLFVRDMMQGERFAHTDALGDDLRVERLVATQRKELVSRPRDTLACTRVSR